MMTERIAAEPSARSSRWSRPVLLLDGGFLVAMGLGTAVAVRQSFVEGTGTFGAALRDSPYVIGFVEAVLLVAVIGVGLLLAGLFAPELVWHVFALVPHLTLMTIDLSFRDLMAQLYDPGATIFLIAAAHAVFVGLHLVAIVRIAAARVR